MTDDLTPNDPLEIQTRRGISQHLTKEGALPICEQCNAGGSRGPVQIHASEDGSIGFSTSMVWVHKPFGEPTCRNVYICHTCFLDIQKEAYGGEEIWFGGWKFYTPDPDCLQCQGRK